MKLLKLLLCECPGTSNGCVYTCTFYTRVVMCGSCPVKSTARPTLVFALTKAAADKFCVIVLPRSLTDCLAKTAFLHYHTAGITIIVNENNRLDYETPDGSREQNAISTRILTGEGRAPVREGGGLGVPS